MDAKLERKMIIILISLAVQPVSTAGLGACDVGWHYYDMFCYQFNTGPERANAAQTACEGESANLASVHSQAEQDFIETIINTNTWIGLNDKTTEGTFVWSDGSPVGYTNWRISSGEPDNFLDAEDCTVMKSFALYKWHDERCDDSIARHAYICKKAAVDVCAPDPCASDATCSVNATGYATCTCNQNYYGDGETSCNPCLTWTQISSVDTTNLMSDNPLQCTTIQKKPDITNEVITLVDVNSACLGPDGATFNITGNVSGTCASMDYFLFSRVLNTDCSSPVVRKCSILNRENSESCQFKCTCPEGSLSVGNEKCHLTMTLNPLTGFSSMDICLVNVLY